jgi:hypothetical protein
VCVCVGGGGVKTEMDTMTAHPSGAMVKECEVSEGIVKSGTID